MSSEAATQQEDIPTKESRSMLSLILEQFFEHKLALISMAIIIFFCLVAIFADVIASSFGIDPSETNILNRYGPFTGENWLGTDEAGRDVLMRLVYGTRISLLVAFVAAISSMIIGVTVGSIAGYFGGVIDSVLMRITDAILALPLIPVLIILARADLTVIPLIGPAMEGNNGSIIKMIIIFVFFGWMIQARLVRGEILKLRESEYVLAAQTAGMPHWLVILKELVPNALSPVIVAVTINVGATILFEAALSFLGLGIQPPTPSWGNMLNNAQEIVYSSPSLAVLPGVLILLVVVSFNFLGDGLEAALDPKAIRR